MQLQGTAETEGTGGGSGAGGEAGAEGGGASMLSELDVRKALRAADVGVPQVRVPAHTLSYICYKLHMQGADC